MHASPLPPELSRRAIRTSHGADYGVSRRRLRGGDVLHPFHGVSAVELDVEALVDRCRMFLPVMEHGQTFTHTTALELRGVPLPRLPKLLHVSVVFPRTPPRRPGIRGHSLADVPAESFAGLPVSPLEAAWAQSASILNREELVAVGDHLLLRSPDLADRLSRVTAAWGRRPGAGRLAWAAPRIRRGVRSRPETHLRLLLMRHRLPEPVVAHPVRVDGGILLYPDLAYPERRLAIEYEGADHRDEARWESDIERRELLAETGWRTIRVTKKGLYGDPAGVVSRVRRQLQRTTS